MAFDGLVAPSSVDALYEARGDDVAWYRPLAQGDVMSGIVLPGVSDSSSVMVVSHPCSMRQGSRLAPRISVIQVISYQEVPLSGWFGPLA